MSIFSKLSGTMRTVFMLGKRGLKLKNNNNELEIRSNNEASLVPVHAANPTQNTHLVTLEYFNNHSGGGGGGNANVLKGTADPTPQLGAEGDLYFKVDGVNILAIYIKDTSTWKIYNANTGPNYSKTFDEVDWFTVSANEYTMTISESVHEEGIAVIAEVYENTVPGTVSAAPYRKVMLEVVVASDGEVSLISTSKFSGKVVIAGK